VSRRFAQAPQAKSESLLRVKISLCARPARGEHIRAPLRPRGPIPRVTARTCDSHSRANFLPPGSAPTHALQHCPPLKPPTKVIWLSSILNSREFKFICYCEPPRVNFCKTPESPGAFSGKVVALTEIFLRLALVWDCHWLAGARDPFSLCIDPLIYNPNRKIFCKSQVFRVLSPESPCFPTCESIFRFFHPDLIPFVSNL